MMFIFCSITESYAAISSIVLNMKDRVIVDDSEVRIADIVTSFSGDLNVINKIKDKVVLNLSNTTQYQRVSNNIIKEMIRLEDGAVDVVFAGFINTIVKVKSQSFSLNDMSEEIVDEVSENISLVSSNYTIKHVGKIKRFNIPAGNVSYKYLLPKSLFQKRITVWADIYVNSKHFKSIPMWFDVSVISEAPILKNKLLVGQKLNMSDLQMKYVDITNIGGDVLDVNKINTLRASKNLMPGVILTYSILEEIPPVYRGQSVKVSSSFGKVSILSNGLSLDDGELGQSVRVKRLGSNQVFKAIVKQQGLVSAVGS